MIHAAVLCACCWGSTLPAALALVAAAAVPVGLSLVAFDGLNGLPRLSALAERRGLLLLSWGRLLPASLLVLGC
jgi:hypothetical protein